MIPPLTPDTTIDRRAFIGAASSCMGWMLLAGAAPAAAARRFGRPLRLPLQQEPWGRIEPLAEGVWALVSTPLVDHPDARRTLCNGGIVAGRDGVAIIEGFGSDEGAAWMAAQAERLTGRRPTHVVVTHYHGDHCNGLHGYGAGDGAPRMWSTETTRTLIAERTRLPEERRVLPDALISAGTPGTLDLGGRVLHIEATNGHTPSDVILRVEDPHIVFCGDLVWNGMFPNYVDADPPRLSAAVRAIGAEADVVYVPGHGELADAAAMRTYADMLDHVGEAAQRAIDAGRPIAEAAAEYRLPAGVADWTLFSPRYFEVAFRAWERQPR